jgi:hypothetical protein
MNQIEISVSGTPVATMSKSTIADSLKSMKNALATDGASPDILLRGWATCEALARYLLPTFFSKPQSPGRIIERLAFEGFITPSEADVLRKLAKIRNSFVHGDLEQAVVISDLETFIQILTILFDFEPDTRTENAVSA